MRQKSVQRLRIYIGRFVTEVKPVNIIIISSTDDIIMVSFNFYIGGELCHGYD